MNNIYNTKLIIYSNSVWPRLQKPINSVTPQYYTIICVTDRITFDSNSEVD